jgi:RNA polymerase primary sigma factor
MADALSAGRSPARDRAVPDAFSAYLSRVSRGELLTHQEELDLGRRVVSEDRLARRTLIEKNLRLVVSVAVKYGRSGVPLEDLIQEGNIGLIEAVERFDPEHGHRFSSYAVWRIRKAVQSAVADQSRALRVPRRAQDRLETLGRAYAELRAQLGREPSEREEASRLGWSVAEARAAASATVDARSLDQPYGFADDDAPAFAEFVADGSVPNIPDAVAHRMELERVRGAVELLPERSRHVVVRRYGLDGHEPAGLAELAVELGISRQGVSQLQQRSVRRLKAG